MKPAPDEKTAYWQHHINHWQASELSAAQSLNIVSNIKSPTTVLSTGEVSFPASRNILLTRHRQPARD